MTVSEEDKPDKPFDEIPQVEKYVEHFLHLLGMYHFVIKSLITNRSVSSCEENPEEVHVTETSRGNDFILDNLHTQIMNNSTNKYVRNTSANPAISSQYQG